MKCEQLARAEAEYRFAGWVLRYNPHSWTMHCAVCSLTILDGLLVLVLACEQRLAQRHLVALNDVAARLERHVRRHVARRILRARRIVAIAAGIGATSQIVEGFARKLIGGLAGKLGKQVLGKTAGSLGKSATNQLTSSAFSFASTYAIGHLAHRYYTNGRSWTGLDAKKLVESLKTDAQELHARYLPQIQQEAGKLNVQKVMAMVRGK